MNIDPASQIERRGFVVLIGYEDPCSMLFRIPGGRNTRSIRFDSLMVAVKEIQDRWLSTDHRYFKFLGNDDAVYIIRQDMTSLNWELIYYKQVQGDGKE